ncbi:MAG TPA: NAD(P)H-hydrate dehydratase [Solirubrobacteraceae bacterium]|nr:NAD(P)H-hydrate dehydratase [Solirubrobacteraceae bacterium]
MPLPDWLDPLYDSQQQRALDAWAIQELGIAGIELMERAGTGLAELVMDVAPTGRVGVVCGKGNNGGDGFVCARFLREHGRDVEVLTLSEDLSGDALTMFQRLPGGSRPFTSDALSGLAAIVDAILGTGFRGQPRDPAASAIAAINQAPAHVIACDVPSGVDASTGQVVGDAAQATATATFHADKPGLWIAPGKGCAGEVRVVDIGIPRGGPADPTVGLIADRVADTIPRRGRESTKFAAGSVLVCGGSIGLTGAPSMAAEAAMRTGAGYVTACVPASLNLVFETRLLEVMTVPLSDSDGSLNTQGADTVLERAGRSDALVLGPGLGRQPEASELARVLAARAEIPLLLDADGLNAHAGALGSLAARGAGTVLTPHAGELARLLGTDSGAVGAQRLHSAREAASQAAAVVVLKGDDTIVAAPDGRCGVSRGGASALATAGTGDVLSGVIGALLAKRLDPFHAACAGVLVHARAGQRTAERIGPEGVIARDVIEELPGVLRAPGSRL